MPSQCRDVGVLGPSPPTHFASVFWIRWPVCSWMNIVCDVVQFPGVTNAQEETGPMVHLWTLKIDCFSKRGPCFTLTLLCGWRWWFKNDIKPTWHWTVRVLGILSRNPLYSNWSPRKAFPHPCPQWLGIWSRQREFWEDITVCVGPEMEMLSCCWMCKAKQGA